MSDNKQNMDGRDSSRVDSNDVSEVEYLHSRYPNLTHQQVLDAVKEFGPLRSSIEEQLDKLQ